MYLSQKLILRVMKISKFLDHLIIIILNILRLIQYHYMLSVILNNIIISKYVAYIKVQKNAFVIN